MINAITDRKEVLIVAKLDKHLYPSVHCGIIRAALILLEQTAHPAAKRFSAGDAEAMVSEAAAPDQIGDRQQGRGLHYYCAVKPDGTVLPFPVTTGPLTEAERQIIADGCLINYYRNH